MINELDALVDTLANIPVNDDGSAVMRIGLMLYTETGNPNNNVKGGYVRAAIRDMTEANKALYINMFNGLNENGDKSDGGKAGLAMAEAWRYYDGMAPYAGNSKVKTDYTGNTAGNGGVEGDLRAAGERARRLQRLALQQPGGRRQLRPQLHHLHQQRRRAGQQRGHRHRQRRC